MERLIQEDYISDPWKMMVSCILLNQTSSKQVRPVLDELFCLIPDPETATKTEPGKISSIIRTTGLYNIKANRIIGMSNSWVNGFKDPLELPGIGKYGRDSWSIFIDRDLGVFPTDLKLISYLETL